MSFTIQDVKDDITGVMHGTSLAQITNLNNVFKRAAKTLISEIDPEGMVRVQELRLYDGVYDYDINDDVGKIKTLHRQANHTSNDNFSGRFMDEFANYKENNTLAINWKDGNKYLRVSKSLSPTKKSLNNCDSLTSDGTWAVGGDAENLTRDTDIKTTGGASFNFDLSGAGTTGYIEASDITDRDLTTHDEVGSIFLRVYIPDTSIITSFDLRWGNDSTNYWSRTITTPHTGTSFVTGWNLLRFDWNGATETGTVDPSAVDYIRFTVTYDGTAETDIRVDDIFSSVGIIFDLYYFSEYMFTVDGTRQGTPTADADTVHLDDAAYNCYLHEVARQASQQKGGSDGASDIAYHTGELTKLYKRYRRNHPNTEMRKVSSYY